MSDGLPAIPGLTTGVYILYHSFERPCSCAVFCVDGELEHRLILLKGKVFMEPLDTDFEVVARESASRRRRSLSANARYNILLIFPALGVLWLLYLVGAAAFQWPVTGVVNGVMTLMIFLFILAALGLFWASAPRHRSE